MGAPDVSDLPSPLIANPAFKPSEAPLFSPTDKSFVLPEEHRPISRHTDWIAADEIPTIDLTPIREAAAACGGDEAQKEAARKVIDQIGAACEKWGFFQVEGHGVPLELLERVEAEAAAFFSLPSAEKKKVERDWRNGYGYYDRELTKNVRDWKEVFDLTRIARPDLPDHHPDNRTVDGWNQFPTDPPGFRSALENWYSAMEGVAFLLLAAVAESLGLPPAHFHAHFQGNHTSQMRLNHYPACPIPGVALGVSRHRDSGALTILVQDDVGGLQVRRKGGMGGDGGWVGVPPKRGAFVINIGNMFQVWSNEKYESVDHRVVVNETRGRLSVPFFFSPSYDTEYAPVPELCSPQSPAKYRAINWGEFSRKRNEGNFADCGVEIQIEHFLIES